MMLSRRAVFGLMMAVGSAFGSANASEATPPPASADTALLIVDAQVGVMAHAWESARIVANLEQLVDRARQRGVPVIWVQHSNGDLPFGSDAWKLVPSLVPEQSELVIHKTFNSSFAETELDQKLRSLGISDLVLAGAATNWCIRATAYAAVERGYNLTLVGDAHTTEPIELPDGKTVSAESMINDLNIVFQWIRVPKVHTEVVATRDVLVHAQGAARDP